VAPIIECIASGCASNLMRVLICLTAPAGSSWAKSGFDDIQILGTSDTKVHLDVRVSRHDWDQNLLTQFRSAWVITKENDRWAAKFRSSFADQ
jgi:hypothetical protein